MKQFLNVKKINRNIQKSIHKGRLNLVELFFDRGENLTIVLSLLQACGRQY